MTHTPLDAATRLTEAVLFVFERHIASEALKAGYGPVERRLMAEEVRSVIERGLQSARREGVSMLALRVREAGEPGYFRRLMLGIEAGLDEETGFHGR